MRAILDEPSLTIAEVRMLRQANAKLLDELFLNGRFSPRVVAALAAIVNADPKRSLDAVAELCGRHPLLQTVSTTWTRSMIKNQLQKHPELFDR